MMGTFFALIIYGAAWAAIAGPLCYHKGRNDELEAQARREQIRRLADLSDFDWNTPEHIAGTNRLLEELGYHTVIDLRDGAA